MKSQNRGLREAPPGLGVRRRDAGLLTGLDVPSWLASAPSHRGSDLQ